MNRKHALKVLLEEIENKIERTRNRPQPEGVQECLAILDDLKLVVSIIIDEVMKDDSEN